MHRVTRFVFQEACCSVLSTLSAVAPTVTACSSQRSPAPGALHPLGPSGGSAEGSRPAANTHTRSVSRVFTAASARSLFCARHACTSGAMVTTEQVDPTEQVRSPPAAQTQSSVHTTTALEGRSRCCPRICAMQCKHVQKSPTLANAQANVDALRRLLHMTDAQVCPAALVLRAMSSCG